MTNTDKSLTEKGIYNMLMPAKEKSNDKRNSQIKDNVSEYHKSERKAQMNQQTNKQRADKEHQEMKLTM